MDLPHGALTPLAFALLVPLVVYRMLWRYRYGRSALDGSVLRLTGRVVGLELLEGRARRPGDGASAIPAFDLETDAGRRYRVEPVESHVVSRGGSLRVGDAVTLDAVHASVRVDEAPYREAALRPALAALRVARGAWPELRGLGPVTVGLALLALGSLWHGMAAPHWTLELDCPRGTRQAGAAPPEGDALWCEVDREELALTRGGQDAVKHGPWVSWWENGTRRQVGEYESGRPQGRWVAWHPNRGIATLIDFARGVEQRRAEFNSRGQLRELCTVETPEDRLCEEFRPDGRLSRKVRTRRGLPHGLSVTYYPSGRIAYEESAVAGVHHGLWRRWSARGRLLEHGTYAQGKKHGRWAAWREDGSLARAGEYRDGEREGIWQFWDASGRLRARGTYDAGIVDGAWVWWHPGGRVAGRGAYRDGEKLGLWRAWHEDGSVARWVRYRY